jgi:DNA (cytosine-5)-methyltransferase 1
MSIPVIDLFSGPGGLGEGFASFQDSRTFKIIVSAEMDAAAHRTLHLRSYFRLLRVSELGMAAYYDYCNGTAAQPWNSRDTRELWDMAACEALQITLGTPEGNKQLDGILDSRLSAGTDCLLIGGPPCQAYSLVGRSRNLGKKDYQPEDDHRHFLYREYLRVLQKIRPAVFVMENVKGILSSQVEGRQIFHDILNDLVDPNAVFKQPGRGATYKIYSLTTGKPFCKGMEVEDIDPRDFVVRSEDHGVPQARHRVILLGVREDIERAPDRLAKDENRLSVYDAIKDLPKLRSRISRRKDLEDEWADTVRDQLIELAAAAEKLGKGSLSEELSSTADKISGKLPVGGLRTPIKRDGRMTTNEFLQRIADPKLLVDLNHESRGHMTEDLRRYAYAAVFAQTEKRSPKGHEEFNLPGLSPNHANWKSGKFADRFRVQLKDRPATTVMSHIAKDGHYFIHYDPVQCRSLTVREAARLQTFPDNYFFQGNRTEQFHQVGNAVPPLLANKIAMVIRDLFLGK